jgi:TP901 family phage tail tape measure protein/lambda family phage tail tape measure protein
MSASGTSPTLTLQIQAPQALSTLQELTAAVTALKSGLAGINTSAFSGSQAGFTRLEAEVKELRAALGAARLENEALAKSVAARTAAVTAGAQKEVAAVREAAQAKKTTEKEVQLEAEKSAAYLLKVQLKSAEMTGALALKTNAAVEASLAAHLAKQEAMQERSALRQAAVTEQAAARAIAAQARATAAAVRRAEVEGGASSGIGRSAVRGVAGATDSLFLTYGQSIPALVGAYAASSAIKNSVQTGSEFNYQTAFSGALGDMTPERLAEMRKEIRGLAADSIYGPVELAKGMRILEQAGVGAADAMKILPVSMKVALQGETDLTQSSETLVGVLNQFGLKVDDVNKVGDAMSKTASVTQASMSSLMQSLKNATGLQRYGVELNTSLAVIGTLAKQGITGTTAGTFTRRFFEELYQPRSTDARRAMKEIGFSAYDGQGKMRKDTDVVSDFVGRMQGYDEQSRNSLLAKIFDERSVKTASTLVTDLSGSFDKLRQQIDESGGALDKFYKTMNGETKLLFEQVKSNASDLLIEGFKGIEGPLNTLLGNMKDFFKDPGVIDFLKLVMLLPTAFVGLANITAEARKNLTPTNDARLGTIDASIEKFRAAGGSEDGVGLRSDQLRQQLALRNQITAEQARAAAPSASQVSAEYRSFRQMEAASYDDPKSATGDKRASLRVTDPLAFAEQQALAKSRESEATAAFRRGRQQIEDETNFAQRLIEEKHRFGLVSEADYTKEIDRLNDKRVQDATISANNELEVLQAQSLLKQTEAERLANTTKQRDIEAKRDHLLRESEFQKQIVGLRREGAIKAADAETQTIVRKHQEQGQTFREQINLQLANGLRGQVDAAQFSAEQQTRQQFLPDIRAVDELIAKKAKDGDDNTGEIAALRERKRMLEDTLGAQVKLNGATAALAKETERSFGYGTQQFFVQYIDAATNAAEQSKAVWGTAMKSVEDATVHAIMTGKTQWRSYANTIVTELVRVQVQKATAGIASSFAPLFGSGTTPASNPGSGAYEGHTGGILGYDTFAYHGAPMSVFDGAKRYHTGGVIGPTEMPIIAEHGEGVFTKEQMKRLAPAGAAPAPQNIRVEMINTGTQQQVTSATPRFDVDGLVIKIITADVRVNGPISQSIENAYGMNRKPR